MNYLAIDLGAESGRVILGVVKDSRIVLEEIYRFPNTVLRKDTSIHWNVRSLWKEIDEGLGLVPAKNVPITSVSTDSWGVDYVLLCGPITPTNSPLDKIGPSEPSYHYRDPRGERGAEEFLREVSWENIFDETGIQYMPINTLFQLASEGHAPNGRLERAVHLLSHADYVNFLHSGIAVTEESMASTFQLYNPRARDWSELLLGKLGVSRKVLGKVVPSGTVLGPFNDPHHWKNECFQKTKVVATCSHDTGCAVAAVPAEGRGWAYLSSGTWSLMGVERGVPIINEKARELNFTNEIGYGGSIRLLKNISGLWLLQECRRIWASQGMVFEYPELTRLAEREPKGVAIIDPMDTRFLAPSSMPEAIREYCRERNLPEPETPPAIARCILESLAQLYRRTMLQLEELTGEKIERLHIVGGGSKNAFLNQLTADACGVPVLAGPVEATALGNILIQAIVSGEVASLSVAREMIGRNFPPQVFTPRE